MNSVSQNNNIPQPSKFTEQELAIINESKRRPFRVLLTTDEQDSVQLRKVSDPLDVDFESKEFKLFIDRLKKTLDEESGVGIAAPQVGIMKRVFLFLRIDEEGMPVQVAINPRIVNASPELVCFEGDGCLSIPDTSANTARYSWVDVEYFDETGELIQERLEGYSREGNFTGIIFQHEFDHLNGVLFIDRIWDK